MGRGPGASSRARLPRASDARSRERRLVSLGDDLVDAYVGYRCWRYEITGGRIALLSVAFKRRWPVGEDVGAVCRCHEMRSKHLGHTCGVYAYTSLDGLLRDPLSWGAPGRAKVFGEVALWGRVRLHEHGYRAEHARVLAVIKMPGTGLEVDSCALQYGIPVVLPPVVYPLQTS